MVTPSAAILGGAKQINLWRGIQSRKSP